jgi:DNA-binding transcriptional ArsR family regulator
MDSVLRALADGTRREILALVSRAERTAGEIAAGFALTRPAISQHLAALLRSDLILMRRAGTRRLYRANPRAVARLRAELDAFWEDALSLLKDRAEAAAWPKTKRRKRQRRKTG